MVIFDTYGGAEPGKMYSGNFMDRRLVTKVRKCFRRRGKFIIFIAGHGSKVRVRRRRRSARMTYTRVNRFYWGDLSLLHADADNSDVEFFPVRGDGKIHMYMI